MTRSRIQFLGTLNVSGTVLGAFRQFQRPHDEHAAVQLSLGDHTDVTSGTLFITGRPNSSVNEATLATVDLATLTSDEHLILDLPILPQMRAILLGGASTPLTTVSVLVMG